MEKINLEVTEHNSRSPIPPFTRASKSLQTNSNSTNNDEEKEEEQSSELRNWSSLTVPLLHSVLRRLDNLQDFFAFRGVCRGWRSVAASSAGSFAASFASHPPLLLFDRFASHTETFYDIAHGRHFGLRRPRWRLSRSSIGYSHGFVITTTRPPFPDLLLWNLFTDAQIRLHKNPDPFDRVILSSNPSSPGCLAILFSRSGSTFQYCHVGDHLWKTGYWNSLPGSGVYWSLVEDMIFFEGKLYALTSAKQLVEVELFPLPKLTLLRAETGAAVEIYGERWLAECGGELLMVDAGVNIVFDVYHWDSGRGRWVGMSSLGGKALFMGTRGFVAFIEPMCSEVRGNCIYHAGKWKAQLCVFSLEDRSLEDVPAVTCGLLRLPPVWVFPSLC